MTATLKGVLAYLVFVEVLGDLVTQIVVKDHFGHSVTLWHLDAATRTCDCAEHEIAYGAFRIVRSSAMAETTAPMNFKLASDRSVVAFILAAFVLVLSACSAESTVSLSEPVDTEPVDTDTADAAETSESTAATETEEPEPADDGSAPSDPADVAGDLQPGDVIVRLLDAGSEPRQLLRFDLPPSCAELMIIDQTQELAQTLGGIELPSAGPVQTLTTLRLTSTSLGPDGYEIVGEVVSAVAGPTTDPAVAAAMNTNLVALESVRTYAQVTDRALLIPGTARTEGTDALGPIGEMMETINSRLASPLPEEAVGVGGSWEVINLVELQGLRPTTRTVLTVEAIDGPIVTASITATQSMPTGAEIVVPGLSAEVLEWQNATSGMTTIDLQSLVPVESSVTIEAFQSFATDEAGGTLDQEVTIQMSVEGQLEDGCAARPGRARP